MRPRTQGGQTARYEKSAYVRLGVSADAVKRAVRITPMLAKLGGSAKVWEYLEGCENADARKLVEFRDRLSSRELAAVTFEAIMVAAGMSAKHAFGVVSEAIFEHSQQLSSTLVRQAMPEIVEETIRRAKGMDGTADTKLLMQHTRFVPVNKNATTTNHNTFVSGDVIHTKNELTALPAHESATRRLNDRFNSELAVPAAVEAEFSVEDEEAEDGEED